MIDAQGVRVKVVECLNYHGFGDRGGLESFFTRSGSDLRFRVGTSRGEVSVMIQCQRKSVDTLRVFTEATLREALKYLDEIAK